MKKNIFQLILTTLIIFGLAACQKDYVPPVDAEIVDAVIDNDPMKQAIQRGGFTAFVDVSRGGTNRTWTVPSSGTILNEGNPSDHQIIRVQFEEPGLQTVGLKVEFPDSQLNIDTFFTVDVLDFVQTKVNIESIESSFVEETTSQISMYEGGAITFADSSIGKPNRRLWIFEGGDPKKVGGESIDEDEKVKAVTVQYPEIGVYDLTLVTWRQFPEGEADTLFLPDYINVVQNVEPPSVVSVEEGLDQVVRVAFNLPMKLSGDLSSNFTLIVDGEERTITGVAVSSTDDRVVEITQDGNINHNATASISYDGGGELSRINDTKAEAFSDVAVAAYQPPNLLEMAGIDPTFESGSVDWFSPNLESSNSNPSTVNDGVFFELANEGYNGSQNAFVMHLNPNETLGEGEKNNFRVYSNIETNPLSFEAGKFYKFEFRYKVVGNGGAEFTSRFHGSAWPPAPGGGWTSGNDTNGEWKFREIRWKAATEAEIPEGRISIQFISKNNAATKVYIDNILLYAEYE